MDSPTLLDLPTNCDNLIICVMQRTCSVHQDPHQCLGGLIAKDCGPKKIANLAMLSTSSEIQQSQGETDSDPGAPNNFRDSQRILGVT